MINEPNDVTGMYEVIFDEKNHHTAPIRVLEGTFKDFVYKYGEVKVGDFEEEDQDVPLKFDYELLEAPESYKSVNEDAEQVQFEQLIGDILYDIIVNSDMVKEAVREANYGDRNNNTE